MAVTKQEIDSFHQFVDEKLQSGAHAFTLEELLDLWRAENPSPEQVEEDLLAVKAALRDMQNGDNGIEFDEHVRDVRTKFNLSES